MEKQVLSHLLIVYTVLKNFLVCFGFIGRVVGTSGGKIKWQRRKYDMDSDDSMNPYRHSSYMNLLQSQQETHNLEYTPYESPCSDAPSEAASPQQNRRSRHTWLPTDDVMLVSAWLNTSKDPITSNQQRQRAFWGRIADYFATCPNAAGRPKREASHCKQRWGKINDLVCKFAGCYEAATRERSSGQNEDDHAWRELIYDQKWCASTSTKGTGVKRGRVCGDGSAQDAQPVIDVDNEPMVRPPGVKAAKAAKGKSKKSSNTQPDVEADGKAFLEFQLEKIERMYEMKQKDFALKEKEFAMKKEHMKHVMLENLIAKKDSLTESEKALKDKLIDDMMSLG
ncbi:PREDICTED: glutathione S-transferase T3-like [Camelina sativa]|uniref:Glutathione S-transferase T3-like n=1 Tax=Camelina sativa TaxID=90675 RepID=A0ABM0YXJ1_CAMSA|nr:PREDICTED: glutathione S-transferase T3-like [Camelina sativa]